MTAPHSTVAFHIWRDDPPPRDTYVWARYTLTQDKWQMVKTCKRGCCVYAFGCSMVLPKFWAEATPEEAASEDRDRSAIKPIDPWDLLE